MHPYPVGWSRGDEKSPSGQCMQQTDVHIHDSAQGLEDTSTASSSLSLLRASWQCLIED